MASLYLPRTPTDQQAEARWEDEGGSSLPDRAWAKQRDWFDRIYRSLFEIDFSEIEKRVIALFGGNLGGRVSGGIVKPGLFFGYHGGQYPSLRRGEIPAILTPAYTKPLTPDQLRAEERGVPLAKDPAKQAELNYFFDPDGDGDY